MNGCGGDGCQQGRWPQLCNCGRFSDTVPTQPFRVPDEFQEPQVRRSPALTLAWLVAYAAVMALGIYQLTH